MSKSNAPLSRESIFDQDFRTDLTHWISVDRKVALRVMDLVDAVMCDPFNGIGKPEPLKYLGSGIWSRRITQEHRLVYLVEQNYIKFLQCRYHY
ncbi:Txe/YoeB family addiction module toxin [Pseudanabaena sp. Chao 1811]|uniref:Txe/YoeB family addiction module toxin n=1 Tax=Pseudanabaena sp. Chao 1811 TaxID=2963092 RepID=UPI0022F3A2A8|nr:Txe/YoeB family addiction module toxin [Pseudanabaena sp. Chao 1811]